MIDALKYNYIHNLSVCLKTTSSQVCVFGRLFQNYREGHTWAKVMCTRKKSLCKSSLETLKLYFVQIYECIDMWPLEPVY